MVNAHRLDLITDPFCELFYFNGLVVNRMEHKDFEIMSAAEQVEEEFLYLYEKYNVADAPTKQKADIIDSFWSDIYKKVFKPEPDVIKYNNCKSKLKTYDVEEVEEVCDMYIKLNKRFGGVIKINQFANLTGIHRATLWLWNKNNTSNSYIFNLNNNAVDEEGKYIYITNIDNRFVEYKGNSRNVDSSILSSLRFDCIKKLREEMQDSNTNGLSNDTMGHAIRANNEEELGKLYEPKRMMQQEAVKRVLTASELPKLGNKMSNAIPVHDQTVAGMPQLSGFES